MKKLKKIIMLLLCCSMLCSCAAVGGNKVPKGMKKYDVVYAKGFYLIGQPGYDGNSDEAQSRVSTQKFRESTLPVGSQIVVAEGCEARMLKWSSFPTEGTEQPISGTVTVDADFWNDTQFCAFDFACSDDSFADRLSVLVPETAADRREMTWNDDETLSILTVGNSFSDDAMEYVWKIAQAAGVKNVILGNLYYGGCRVAWHYEFWLCNSPKYEYRENVDGHWRTAANSTFEAAFGTYDWDFISFQQSAQVVQSEATNYEDLYALMQMARERCPDAKFVWHMPWANPHENYNNSTETMFRDLLTAQRMLLENYSFDEILTTGTGIQNARTSYIPTDEFIRDGWHLSFILGRYIAGLTFFTQLTGISVKDISFAPEGLSEEYKQIAIEAAENARLNPRMLMQSKYTQK